jgi:hypothetical protein
MTVETWMSPSFASNLPSARQSQTSFPFCPNSPFQSLANKFLLCSIRVAKSRASTRMISSLCLRNRESPNCRCRQPTFGESQVKALESKCRLCCSLRLERISTRRRFSCREKPRQTGKRQRFFGLSIATVPDFRYHFTLTLSCVTLNHLRR